MFVMHSFTRSYQTVDKRHRPCILQHTVVQLVSLSRLLRTINISTSNSFSSLLLLVFVFLIYNCFLFLPLADKGCIIKKYHQVF